MPTRKIASIQMRWRSHSYSFWLSSPLIVQLDTHPIGVCTLQKIAWVYDSPRCLKTHYKNLTEWNCNYFTTDYSHVPTSLPSSTSCSFFLILWSILNCLGFSTDWIESIKSFILLHLVRTWGPGSDAKKERKKKHSRMPLQFPFVVVCC